MKPAHHVLIVGAGSIGERHLRCFQATERAQVSFVEINSALRARIAQQYHATAYDSLEAALAASNNSVTPLGAAVIATPAHLHIAQATELAQAGLHLLIEKPLSTSLDGIDQLRQIVRQRQLVAAVAYVYREFPSLASMREALLNGRFGRPVELIAVCGQNFPTYRPAYRDTYYAHHATGGGAIQDALTHVFNAGEWLLGRVDRLVADAAHSVLAGVQVEDTVHVLARHGDVLASYSLNQHQAPNEVTLTVVCEHGTLRWELHAQRWRWMTTPDEPWHDEPHPSQPRDAAFIAQAHRFLDCLDGTAAPACSLDEGLQTLRVNLAALASVSSGAWQTPGDAT